MTTQLTISNKNLNCDDILKQLLTINLDSNVIPGKSLVDNNFENSCQITFSKQLGELRYKPVLKYAWNKLQYENKLTCGHLKIEGKFSGCILDYLTPSLCPGNRV